MRGFYPACNRFASLSEGGRPVDLRPAHTLADEPAERAARRGQRAAGKAHLARVGLAILGVEGLAFPFALAGGLHVIENALAELRRATGILQPDDVAADGIAALADFHAARAGIAQVGASRIGGQHRCRGDRGQHEGGSEVELHFILPMSALARIIAG